MPNYDRFSNDMLHSLIRAWINEGATSEQAARLAMYGTCQTALESGYGTSNLAQQHNYGGLKNGNKEWQSFNSMDDFAKSYVGNLLDKYPTIMNATTLGQYTKSLFDGLYQWNPDEGEKRYRKKLESTQNRINGAIRRKWKDSQH